MISYDLECVAGHRFEGWFRSSVDFEKQKQSGILDCPTCGSIKITKCLSAPNIGRKGNQAAMPTPAQGEDTVEAPSAVMSNTPEISDKMQEAFDQVAKIQAESLKESKWVGRKFADEARAIHYGETEAQIIHGETSADEAEALAEEGVPLMPLLFPVIPPEAKN